MASEYDVLLSHPAVQKVSEYDALLSHPAAVAAQTSASDMAAGNQAFSSAASSAISNPSPITDAVQGGVAAIKAGTDDQIKAIPSTVKGTLAEHGYKTAAGEEALRSTVLSGRERLKSMYLPEEESDAILQRAAEAGKPAAESAKDFSQLAADEQEAQPKGNITTAVRGLTSGAAMMATATLGTPAMALQGATEAYGEAKNAGKDEKEAEHDAVQTLIGLAAFGGSNTLVSKGIAKYLGNAPALKTFLVQAMGQSAGNEATSRVMAAYEAAMNAPEGQRMQAAAEAAKKFNLEATAQNVGFGVMGAGHSAGEASTREGVGPVVGETPETNFQKQIQAIPDEKFEAAIKQYQKLPDNDPRKHAFEGEIARRAQAVMDAGTPTEPQPAAEVTQPPSEVPQVPESQEIPQTNTTGTSSLFKQAQADALKEKARQAAVENPDVSATAQAVGAAADVINTIPEQQAPVAAETEGGETPNEKETNEGRQQEGREGRVLLAPEVPALVIPETVQPPSVPWKSKAGLGEASDADVLAWAESNPEVKAKLDALTNKSPVRRVSEARFLAKDELVKLEPKAPAAAPVEKSDFAKQVESAVASVPEENRYGGKAWIHEAYDAWKAQTGSSDSLEQFKQRLMEEQTAGGLKMSRADITTGENKRDTSLSSEKMKASETGDSLSQYHFITTPEEATKPLDYKVPQKAEATPAIQTPEGKVATGEDHVAAYEEAKKETPDTSGSKEGFVDENGNFITREQAAKKTGLPTETEEGKLHSSDLPSEPPEVKQRAIEEVSKVESLLGDEEEPVQEPVKRAAKMTQEGKLTRLNTELAEARKSGNTRAAKDIRARIKELGKVKAEEVSEAKTGGSLESDIAESDHMQMLAHAAIEGLDKLSDAQLRNRIEGQAGRLKKTGKADTYERVRIGLYYKEAVRRGLDIPRIPELDEYSGATTALPAPAETPIWQKTREQAKTEGILAKHRFAVKEAVERGEQVPLEVLEGFEGSKWADDARRKLYGKEISKSLLEKAEDFLKDDKGTLYADPLFIQTVGKPALRAAVKLIREGIEGGKLVRDAVEDAMTYIRSNVKGLDEDAAKKFFQPIIGDEPVTDGPETNFKMPEKAEEPPVAPPREPTPVAPEGQDTTATYNAETDKLLEKNGFAPIAKEASKALGQSWSEALKLSQDFPEAGSKLVDELNKSPRALNDVDSGVLLKELADRKARQAQAQDVVFRTSESGDESRNAEATAQLEKARNDVYEAITAAKAASREWGRAGRFKQIHIDDDYSLIAMENKVRSEVNKGKPLSEEQATQVAKRFKEIEKAEEDFEKAQQAHLDADATAEADKVQQDIKKPARKSVLKVAKEVVDRWKAEAEAEMGNLKNFFGSETGAVGDVHPKGGRKMGEERKSKIVSLAKVIRARVAEFGFDRAAALKNLVDQFSEKVRPYFPDAWTEAKSMLAEKPPRTPQDIMKEQKAGSPLDPKVVFELAQAHAHEGVGSKMGVEGMNELMAAVHKDLEPLHDGLTEREVRDAFSGYGKVANPSKEAVNVQLREARRLGQLASGIEDALNKQAPKKSGAQRDKPTQAIREQTNKLRDAMRAAGIEPSAEDQLASVNAARETALRNRIEDIRKEIETGEKRPKGTPVPDSDAVKALKVERDKAQAELDAINEARNPKKSPEQIALDSAIKAVQKSISKYDEMLKTGDTSKKATIPKFAPSDELETLQNERDAMKNAVAEMRKEASGKAVSKEERARQIAIKALDKRIADLENRIRTGNVSKVPKRVSEADQFTDVRAKRAQVNALKEKLDALQKQQTAMSETQIINDRYQKAIAKRIAELEERTKAGDFSKAQPKPKAQLNQVSLKAKADFERAKEKFDLEVEKQRRENLPPSQKFWNHFVGLERAGKLTSVGVFGKLGIAALAREFVTTPVEELAGSAISKVISGLAERAPRQGAGSLKAEIAAKRAFFTEGMRDAWQNLTFRKSDLESAYGKKKYRELPPAWYEYMGFLHGAIKAPVKRAEFARSLQKRMEWAEKQGRNINDPNVMTELSQEAYLDGERAIFMQDNAVSKGLTAYYRVQEADNKRWMSVLGRFFLPVVKVPTNIFGETFESTGLPAATNAVMGGAKALHEAGYSPKEAALAVKKGIEQLPPEQADVIMRQLKKGLIGPAMLALGYFGANSIGGFYHKDDKRSPSDVQPGNYRVGGVNLPRVFGHTVPAMLLNIGATARRVAEEREAGQKKGLAVGAERAAAGMVSELPFVPVLTSTTQALETEQGFDRFIQGLVASSVVPGVVSNVARLKDTPGTFPANTFVPPNARQPGKGVQGVVDAVKMGIPGERETVPLKRKKRFSAFHNAS